MTEQEEFKSASHAYRVAVGEEADEINLSNVFGFLMLTVLVLTPFWAEHVVLWIMS